jgi:lon-related putative ATP-dependent protease
MPGKEDRSTSRVQAVDLEHYPLPKPRPHKSLKAEQCRWRVDHKTLGFKTTREVKPLSAIIGQPRASAALKLGAMIRGKGYNVFVTGLSATGRSTAVKNILEGLRLRGFPVRDHCYVNNFKSPDQPRLITLDRGKGRELKREMARLIETLKRTIPHALEDETVLAQKRELAESYAKKEAELFKALETKVGKGGFALVQVQMGPYTRPDIFPIIDGNPVPPNQVGRLVEEGKFPKKEVDALYKRYQGYKADLRALLKQVRALTRELSEKTAVIEKEILNEIVKDHCQDLGDRFLQKSVDEYLCEVRDFIVEHPAIFQIEDSDQPPQNMPAPPAGFPGPMEDMRTGDPFRIFEVNVIRDSLAEDKRPVIIEHHPNYQNLFGSIEREWRFGGVWATDFTQIRAGSLLRADGGYLVLNAMDVLQEPLAWRTLMRTMKTCMLQIQGVDALLSISPATIKPQPIDIDITVILIGDAYLYHLLNIYEDDFARTFKVRADFDRLMPRGRKQIGHYAALASKMTNNESTLPLTAKAVARLAERGALLGGRGGKMSARLGEIADVIREASHFADAQGVTVVDESHIMKAVREAEYRQDLVRERVEEAIGDEVIMIATEGREIGQINGLAVHDLGAFSFGRPQRITCEVSMGDAGVVNIEREAKLSGSIHDKGVLILDGYLRHMYGMDGPISLSASLCFEQSYSQVDGDSASLAEALVLVSELSGIPLRQDLAVTGSVNQKGKVQAIGGVNEKIEGFYRICRMNGFTGTNGVVLPKSNVPELMLSDEVLGAIAAGNFSIIPVDNVDQAIEVFTEVAAGRKLKKGGWTKGSVHDRVDLTLSDFYWATKTPTERDEGKAAAEARKLLPKPRRRKKKDEGPEPPDPRDQGEPM